MENFELGHEMEKDVVLLVKRVGQRSFISRSVRVFFSSNLSKVGINSVLLVFGSIVISRI